ncbi:MAG TPA: hypothetical protein EYP59_19790 [Thiotrichaceae bacterium]|nr:hypothetical protein [Thiotrichaceae bacterium]
MTDYFKQLWADLVLLCRTEPPVLATWLDKDWEKIQSCLIWLILGSSLYGASIGLWRAPLQSVYVAIKFPLLIILTTLGNAIINGMLAQLLGAKISFRQSFLAVIMSFTLIAIILGAFTPLSLFLLYNLPPMGTALASQAHALVLILHVILIAFVGIVANIHLFKFLEYICANRLKAKQILFTWLGVNLFLGCQLSWNLRPFFGTPHLEVHFLRDDPFNGSFYEAVFYILKGLLF